MKHVHIWVLVVTIVISLAVSGCGGGAKVKTETRTTTLGKELTDLDKAYKSGILSEKEYKSAKDKLLKNK
jgi:hypothetical protein